MVGGVSTVVMTTTRRRSKRKRLVTTGVTHSVPALCVCVCVCEGGGREVRGDEGGVRSDGRASEMH